MTRKDYVLIADVLNTHININNDMHTEELISDSEHKEVEYRLEQLTDDFCYKLAQDNPKFNKVLFLAFVKNN